MAAIVFIFHPRNTLLWSTICYYISHDDGLVVKMCERPFPWRSLSRHSRNIYFHFAHVLTRRNRVILFDYQDDPSIVMMML